MVKTAGRRQETPSGRRRRYARKTHRGGTYTTNVTSSINGYPQIDSIRESACGAVDNRFGNNTVGGKRRHRKTSKRGGRRRKTRRGGGMQSSPNYPGLVYPTSDMALNVPRAGYGFVQGPGTAGYIDFSSIY